MWYKLGCLASLFCCFTFFFVNISLSHLHLLSFVSSSSCSLLLLSLILCDSEAFKFSVPFTGAGKSHGDITEQMKRNVIVYVEKPFPFVKTRQRVIKKVEVSTSSLLFSSLRVPDPFLLSSLSSSLLFSCPFLHFTSYLLCSPVFVPGSAASHQNSRSEHLFFSRLDPFMLSSLFRFRELSSFPFLLPFRLPFLHFTSSLPAWLRLRLFFPCFAFFFFQAILFPIEAAVEDIEIHLSFLSSPLSLSHFTSLHFGALFCLFRSEDVIHS